jgi:hypothetical protein
VIGADHQQPGVWALAAMIFAPIFVLVLGVARWLGVG